MRIGYSGGMPTQPIADTPDIASLPADAVVENWGYFDDAKREFVLTTPTPPRPWKNILWNHRFNTQPTQNSSGIAYRRDVDGYITLLNWTNRRLVYIIDRDTNEAFNLGGGPLHAHAPQSFVCRYGLGYHVTEQRCLDVAAAQTLVVPPDEHAELQRLTLTNERDAKRRLRVILLNDVDLNFRHAYFHTHNVFAGAIHDKRVLSLVNDTYLADRLALVYLASDAPMAHWSLNAEHLMGVYGSDGDPAHLHDFTRNDITIDGTPTMIAAWDVDLAPGASHDLHLAFGCVENRGDVPAKAFALAQADAFDAAMQAVRDAADARYRPVQVATPDPVFDRYTNTWIKHQMAYCADWNRGWGKGFRDGMQDAWSYCALDPAQTRAMITDALAHQYPDGRTLRKWAPVDAKPYNDGGLWMVFAASAYLRETGDFDFLKQVAGYFESSETGDVLDHMKRAVNHLLTERGEHGLCKMPFGDWNDRLSGPGKDGRGGSAWTTLTLVATINELEPIAERAGVAALSEHLRTQRARVIDDLHKNAWNGRWFNRAITDAGQPVGHPDNDEGRIYLLPQAWAILSGVATDEQAKQIIAACDEHLAVDHGYVLLAPAYTKFDPGVGHLSGSVPGEVENGGNYVHACMFMMSALANSGRLDHALELYRKVLSVNPLNPPSHSRQEPFSLTNSYRGPAAGEHAGRSVFSWRTGAAGWAWRNAIEGLLGVRAELDGLRIRGTLPTGWNGTSLKRTYRGMNLTVQWESDRATTLVVDGHEQPVGLVPLEKLRDGATITCR